MLLQWVACAIFSLDFASYVTRFLEDARTRRFANAAANAATAKARGFFLGGGEEKSGVRFGRSEGRKEEKDASATLSVKWAIKRDILTKFIMVSHIYNHGRE